MKALVASLSVLLVLFATVSAFQTGTLHETLRANAEAQVTAYGDNADGVLAPNDASKKDSAGDKVKDKVTDNSNFVDTDKIHKQIIVLANKNGLNQEDIRPDPVPGKLLEKQEKLAKQEEEEKRNDEQRMKNRREELKKKERDAESGAERKAEERRKKGLIEDVQKKIDEANQKSAALQRASAAAHQRAVEGKQEQRRKAEEQEQKKRDKAQEQQNKASESAAKREQEKRNRFWAPGGQGDDIEIRQNHRIADSTPVEGNSYTYAFWIEPKATTGGWGSVLHHGNNNGERNPAFWFYPGQTRLHCRSGVPSNWNAGADPGHHLPIGQWTHVAMVHSGDNGLLQIYFNGALQVQTYARPGPIQRANRALYAGDPWYEPARADLADLRVYPRALSSGEVQEVVREQKHPH